MSHKNFEFQVFDNYILLERIGRGGRGEVYLGRQIIPSGLGKFVAIKRIAPEYLSDLTTLSQFESEAKLALKLKHNNIVSMIDVGFFEKQHFLVMDFVEGYTLQALLLTYRKKLEIIPLKYALFYISSVALALEYARRTTDPDTGEILNVVHRDISPHNIMINREGEVKVIDFGVAGANLASSEASNKSVMGKFGYMSPEQAKGEIVDHRSDLFSLGIVFWELLSGTRMITKVSVKEARKRMVNFDIEAALDAIPHLSNEIANVLRLLLNVDVEQRYQTAGELHKDVNYLLNSKYPGFTQERSRIFINSVFKSNFKIMEDNLVVYSKNSLKLLHSSSSMDVLNVKEEEVLSFESKMDPGKVVYSTFKDPQEYMLDGKAQKRDAEENSPNVVLIHHPSSVKDIDSQGEKNKIQNPSLNSCVDDPALVDEETKLYRSYNPYEKKNPTKKSYRFGLGIVMMVVFINIFMLYFTELGGTYGPIDLGRKGVRNVVNGVLHRLVGPNELKTVRSVRRSIASSLGIVGGVKSPVYIQSSPKGAKIYINGVLQELRTPNYVYISPRGYVSLRVSHPGHKNYTSKISSQSRYVRVKLLKK